MYGSRREIAEKEGTLPGKTAGAPKDSHEASTPSRQSPGADQPQPRASEHGGGRAAPGAA
ncbi:MAG TPA: hypothetical protein VGP15_03215, partial [Burkholderiales bacterium]|nr:hypothetical protein [Burkholderiales bacterium]